MSDEIDSPFEEIGAAAFVAQELEWKAQAEAALRAKVEAGRYTLVEAAKHIAEATNERLDEITAKLMDSVFAGGLPVYEPGKKARYRYGKGFASCVRDFYEEAYWNDLNKWLEANEPQVEYKFPAPVGALVPTSEIFEIRKRANLIKEVAQFWPTVDRDLRDASRNGLSEAAKHTKNTFWKVQEALNWANQRGKVVKKSAQSFISSESDSPLSPMLRGLLKLD